LLTKLGVTVNVAADAVRTHKKGKQVKGVRMLISFLNVVCLGGNGLADHSGSIQNGDAGMNNGYLLTSP
jgi:hypothetical protein